MTEQGRCGGVHGDSGTQVLPICELTSGSKDRESPFKMIKCYTLWRGLVELSCERITYRMSKQSAHIRAELIIVVGS